MRVGGAKGGYLCDSPMGAEEQQEQRAWSRPGTPQEAQAPTHRAPHRSRQLLHKEARYRNELTQMKFLLCKLTGQQLPDSPGTVT